MLLLALTAAGISSAAGAPAAPAALGLGRAPTPAEIAAWDIDVRADGRGLPPGRGDVPHGAEIYARKCEACHGAGGQGGVADPLVGGQGTLASAHPLRTVGSYWPYATTLFDYVRRAMPFDAPQSLSANEVYALTAYILSRNGVVPAGAVMDARSLPKVRMPNRDGFITVDPRPDTGTAGPSLKPEAAASGRARPPGP